MTKNTDRELFQDAMKALSTEVANIGFHTALDAKTRMLYANEIRLLSQDIEAMVALRQMSWKSAAETATEIRNELIASYRSRSTPVGRAIAEWLKANGRSLNDVIAKYTVKLYGSKTSFVELTNSQQNVVYREVVRAVGRSNSSVTSSMLRLSNLGCGLLLLSLAISVHTVATAENKLVAIKHEAAVTGAGIGGGIAGGALAGLACGPGAPICVTIGAFAGGALAAFGVARFL